MFAFAKIGKKPLTTIIRVQDNYKEIIADDICQVDTPKCNSCPLQSLEQVDKSNLCAGCSGYKTEIKEKIKYINERNMFGYQPALKTNAILLFIAYHFLGVDTLGFVKNVNTKELSDLLHCDIKTVRNNTNLLVKYGYIMASGEDKDHFMTIYLPDYKNNFNTAAAGGRGYLNLSFEAFLELCKLKSLNALRIYLRQLIKSDVFQIPESKLQTQTITYKETLRALPSYCNRSIVKASVSYALERTSLFFVKEDIQSISFTLQSSFNARNTIKLMTMHYTENLTTFCRNTIDRYESILDSLIEDYQIVGSYPSGIKLPEPEKLRNKEDRVFRPSPSDIKDFAQIAIQYNSIPVMEAIEQLFIEVSLKQKKVANPGGYVRRFIQNQISSLKMAS